MKSIQATILLMLNQSIIILALVIVVLWLSFLSYLYFRQQRFFRTFTQDITKKDLKSILKNIASSIKTIGNELNDLNHGLSQLEKQGKTHFQKFGFIRYNPFSDTGGDQSFSLCLLNQDNSGFILTSLHSREQTRIYAKNVIAGLVKDYELSKEETEVLKQALKK